MYGNDTIGDCTCAETGHQIQAWTGAAGSEVTISQNDVVSAYSAISGYNPQTGANDNGCVIADVLKYWQGTGIGGHKIGAYVQVDVKSGEQIGQGANFFGGLNIGVQLPMAAQSMSNVWLAPQGPLSGNNAPGSWGGHCVYVVGYSPFGATVVTWGQLVVVEWGFWEAYVDEAWAIVSQDFLNGKGVSPQGFDLAQLNSDLAAV